MSATNATRQSTSMRNLSIAVITEILAEEAAKREPTPKLPSASSDELHEMALDLDYMLFDATSTGDAIRSKAKDIVATAIRFLLDFEGG
jgi:hypothetical protein